MFTIQPVDAKVRRHQARRVLGRQAPLLFMLFLIASLVIAMFVPPRAAEPPQRFNVKSYGATGSGTSDDTRAIAAAFAAASSAGGGTVYFPAGTYRVRPHGDKMFAVPSKTVIVGDGATTFVRVADDAGATPASSPRTKPPLTTSRFATFESIRSPAATRVLSSRGSSRRRQSCCKPSVISTFCGWCSTHPQGIGRSPSGVPPTRSAWQTAAFISSMPSCGAAGRARL